MADPPASKSRQLLKALIPPFIRRNPYLRGLARILYARLGYKLLNLRPARLNMDAPAGQRLLVDVSVLCARDHGTGIQRVAKNLYNALARQYPELDIAPICASTRQKGWFMAKSPDAGWHFEKTAQPLAPRQNDVFLGLDFSPAIILAQLSSLRAMQGAGIRFFFLLHDLLPISFPGYFPTGTKHLHEAWLREIASLGDIICVSQTVQTGLAQYYARQKISFQPERLHFSHNGYSPANFAGAPEYARDKLPQKPYFLLVSTIEPRKGHAQTLAAFSLLWRQGLDLALVLVGREGWKMDAFCGGLRGHPGLGKSLFWYDQCDDATLGALYEHALCLLMPSEGEGFGLAIIEGAAHGKPLIARDLPVFHEIAGEHAFYFQGMGEQDLAEAIKDWLNLRMNNAVPDSTRIKIPTWEEAAAKIHWIMFAKRRGNDGND